MNKLISYVISKILNRSFSFDQEVPVSYVIQLVFHKISSLLRGLIFLRKKIFLGKKVSIKAKRWLTLGKLVIIGDQVSIDALGKDGISIGNYSKVGSCSYLIVSGSLSNLGKGIVIGDNVGIGEFAYIGGAGGVIIGSDTIIGQYLSIHPENHIFSKTDQLIRDQGVSRKGISIGRNCWIGAKVTFCDGASIGDGCVIAAGSVVTKHFESNSVIAGVPAKYIKKTYE